MNVCLSFVDDTPQNSLLLTGVVLICLKKIFQKETFLILKFSKKGIEDYKHYKRQFYASMKENCQFIAKE